MMEADRGVTLPSQVTPGIALNLQQLEEAMEYFNLELSEGA